MTLVWAPLAGTAVPDDTYIGPGLEVAAAAPPRRAPIDAVGRSDAGIGWRRAVPVVLAGSDLLALGAAMQLTAGHLGGAAWIYASLVLALLAVGGAFRHRLSLRLADEIPSLVGCLTLPLVALLPLLEDRSELLEVVHAVPVAALLVLAGRAVSYAAIRAARARHRLSERTLIVGAGRVAVDLAHVLLTHREYGLMPVGFLDGFRNDGLPLPLLGDVHELDQVLRGSNIQTVIIAFGSRRDPDMVKVLRACDRAETNVHVVPRFFELGAAPQSKNVDSLWGIPVVQLRRAALRSRTWRLKRIFDLVVVSLLLPVTAPLFALIALGVRFTSPGPIFFRQKRVGQGGRLIEVLKFRTLHVNDDSDTTWSVTDDYRQTVIGRFLRKSSLDELPQLINVLRGDMSLVGPRPERPHFVSRFDAEIPAYEARHRVPVGMTGWAQIHGLRGDTSLEERARFDNNYIENWSLWGDLVILARTFTAVLRDLASKRRPADVAVAEGEHHEPGSGDMTGFAREDLVTVVIPARNEEGFIGRCLESVLAQSHRALEVIVVDGDSADRTADVVSEYAEDDPRVRLLRNERAIIPVSMNLALAAARGKWLVRIDAHAAIPPDYVSTAVSHLSTGEWGGVGGRKDGVGQTPSGRAIAAAMGSRFGVGNSTYHYGTHIQVVEHIPFGAYPVSVARSIGGWNEELRVNQDFEFDYRLRQAGHKLLFDPALVIRWHSRQSLRDFFGQYHRYGRGKVVVIRRHPRSVRLRHLMAPGLVLMWAVALALLPVAPILSGLMVLPYAGALSLASMANARQARGLVAKLCLPLAFLSMHAAWGIGFWQGLLRSGGNRVGTERVDTSAQVAVSG